MKTLWVERAIIAALVAGLAGDPDANPVVPKVFVFVPGDYHRDNVLGNEWVEPTFGPIDRGASARPGSGATRSEVWRMPIRCVIKSQPKGGRAYAMSTLVDRVRAIVDSTEQALGLQILDDSDPQVCAGAVAWKETQETRTREYGTTITMPGGHEVKGVDVAYLEARAVVRGRL